MPDTLLKELLFQYPFRRYQQQILDRIDLLDPKDQQFHIVAPPGSGKTAVGIELIRRLGSPAVVFAPNSTIALQWRKQVSLFLPEDKKYLLDQIVSTNPKDLKLINIFTYQLISSSDQESDLLNLEAEKIWSANLIENRLVETQGQAAGRIQTMRKKQAAIYAQEIGKYRRVAKNNFLANPSAQIETILHQNARRLIDNLVAQGVKVIVLDEAHHLLDYWALTIKCLSQRIGQPHLIGLTATPPHSASTQEKENYLGLLGEIDYEIPTPAVVKEGNLAPYQDLLYLCEPTAQEKTFLSNIQLKFEEFITQLASEPTFNNFIASEFDKIETQDDWRSYFKILPALSVALVKLLIAKKISIPPQVIIIPEMRQDLTLDDWSVLLKIFSLNYLKMSSDQDHQDLLGNIKATLRMFGYIMTESGVQSNRSPTDLILTFSQAKQQGVIEILKQEQVNLQDQLRCVVITDFEKMNLSSFKKVKNVLDPDAGGAVGIFKTIVHTPETTALEPILITGTSVLVDADELTVIVSAMKVWEKEHKYKLGISHQTTEFEKIIQIVGSGPDWRTSVYVQMITDLFEQGVTRCLVGTRGLIGEGWNSLRINTLLDLTSVTTYTSTNQIRGRALRLDPTSPDKLANIWYMACLDTRYERGDQDLKRVIAKHEHFYGINESGRIIKGAKHIDENLVLTLITTGFKYLLPEVHNRQMLKKSSQRKKVFEQWRIGEAFENVELAGISMNQRRLNFKTVHSIKDSAGALTFSALESLVGIAAWYLQNTYNLLTFPQLAAWSPQLLQVAPIFLLVVIQVHVGYRFKTIYHKVMTQIPVDAYILDIAVAALESLKKLKLVGAAAYTAHLEVYTNSQGRTHIEISKIDAASSKVINNVLSDIFSPVVDQRYLISRSLDRMPLGLLTPLWWLGYSILSLLKRTKPTFHPVPDIIAINKQRSRVFAREWQKYVGGGNLVFTRSQKGSELLMQLRQHNSHEFEKMTYETWQ